MCVACHAGHLLVELAREVAAAAVPRRAVVQRPLEVLRPVDELRERRRRRRRMDHQHEPGSSELRDRGEAVHRVIRKLGVQRRVDRVLVVREIERVAVGRRSRGQLSGDDAGRARAVLHHHRLLERLAQADAEGAREQVGRAALRRGGVDPDRAAGIVLLRRRRYRGRESERRRERTARARCGAAEGHGRRRPIGYRSFSAACCTALTMLTYPVQRQRFPEIASRISSSLGFLFRSSSATLVIIMPGVQ